MANSTNFDVNVNYNLNLSNAAVVRINRGLSTIQDELDRAEKKNAGKKPILDGAPVVKQGKIIIDTLKKIEVQVAAVTQAQKDFLASFMSPDAANRIVNENIRVAASVKATAEVADEARLHDKKATEASLADFQKVAGQMADARKKMYPVPLSAEESLEQASTAAKNLEANAAAIGGAFKQSFDELIKSGRTAEEALGDLTDEMKVMREGGVLAAGGGAGAELANDVSRAQRAADLASGQSIIPDLNAIDELARKIEADAKKAADALGTVVNASEALDSVRPAYEPHDIEGSTERAAALAAGKSIIPDLNALDDITRQIETDARKAKEAVDALNYVEPPPNEGWVADPNAPPVTALSPDVVSTITKDEERMVAGMARLMELEDRFEKKSGKVWEKYLLLSRAANGDIDKIVAAGESLLQKKGLMAKPDKTKAPGDDPMVKAAKEAQQIEEQTNRARYTALRRASSLIQRVAVDIERTGRALTLTGVGVVGGIMAEAGRYAANAKDATAATSAWNEQTEKLARSRKRVDETLTRQALPLITMAANVAEKVSRFVEKNPDLINTAVKGGVLLAGIGVLTTVVAKGLRMVADAAYIAASGTNLLAGRTMAGAATEFMIAAGLMKGAKYGVTGGMIGPPTATTAAGGAGAAGIIGSVGLIITGLIASGAAIALVNQLLDKTGASGKIADAQKKIQETSARPYPGIITGARPESGGLTKVVRDLFNLDDAAAKADEGILKLSESMNANAITDAYISWQDDAKRATKEAADTRKKILEDADKAVLASAASYAKQVGGINAQYNKSRHDIIISHRDADLQAEEDYQTSRADIISEGNDEIKQMEQDHQDNLRKMQMGHDERVAEFIASRDALGLVKENRAFALEKAEAEKEINEEIGKRRQDLGKRLGELQAQFVAEHDQRQAQYVAQLAENEARRKDELKAAAAAYQEEQQVIRDQKAAQLQELDEGLKAERIRRREQFIAQVKELDASLLGERELKSQYYQLMLGDADKWLADYRTKLKAGVIAASANGTTGSKDKGGYVTKGTHKVAQNGIPEFILDGSATRAAERAIGGRLTQESLLRGLGAGGGSRQAVYQDYRRVDAPLSKDMRAQLKSMAVDAITEAMER